MGHWSIIGIIICFIMPAALWGQEAWSLEQCIQEAQANSLGIKQGHLAVANSEVNLRQNQMSRYPTVNSSAYLGLNLGSNFDPISYDRVSQTILNNSLQINAGMPLYQGGRIHNSIKQSRVDIRAAEEDMSQISRDIALQVAQAYLQILLSSEQLVNVRAQLQQSQEQLQQTNKLIRAGTLPANNRLDIEAQIARNEQAVVAAENALEIAYINLKQLMQVDTRTDIVLDKPEDLEVDEQTLAEIDLGKVYQQSLATQPNVRAGELRVESAALGEQIAHSALLPSVNLSLGTNTTYSQFLSGNTFFPEDPYFRQLNNNWGSSVGVSISYPIWDNNVARYQKERARLNIKNVELQNEQLKQQLLVEIQNAYANALAAQKTYQAAEKALIATQTAYDNTQKRYDIGAGNAFELSTAQNNLTLAQNEGIRSKYDYIFRLKILDFYTGKEISLK